MFCCGNLCADWFWGFGPCWDASYNWRPFQLLCAGCLSCCSCHRAAAGALCVSQCERCVLLDGPPTWREVCKQLTVWLAVPLRSCICRIEEKRMWSMKFAKCLTVFVFFCCSKGYLTGLLKQNVLKDIKLLLGFSGWLRILSTNTCHFQRVVALLLPFSSISGCVAGSLWTPFHHPF